jgi:hypothetical protein
MAVVLAALLVIGCGGVSTPTPTAGTMDDFIAALVLQGVTVHRMTGGEPGCPGTDLHDNATHLEVAVGSQSALKSIYLFRWRRQSDFNAAGPAFADCIAEYEAANPGVSAVPSELSPWRAFGPNWDPQLRTIVEQAMLAITPT